jgi:hypothetical protein
MEPRKVEAKKAVEVRKHECKTRFRIEKLEERIAPARGGIPGAPGGRGSRWYCT